MIKLNVIDVELLFKCFFVGIFTYACFIALIEISIYYILVPVLIYCLISFVSLQSPKESDVNDILGLNPRAQLRTYAPELIISNEETYFCIAYRAADFDSTENSLGAIKLCAKNGCKFVHLDVRITADNVGVISNQEIITFKNDPSHSLDKPIEESLLSEVEQSISTENANLKTQIEKIPSLDEAIILCKDLKLKIMLNVVHSTYYNGYDSVVNIILKSYENNPYLYKNCVISSSNPILLYKLRKFDKNIIVALFWKCYSETSMTSISWLKNTYSTQKLQHCLLELVDSFTLWLLNNFIYRIIGISAVILPKHLITPNVVEFWEIKSIRCIAAVVNLSVEKLYYKNGLGIAYLTDTVAGT